jgi:hypothetical protein
MVSEWMTADRSGLRQSQVSQLTPSSWRPESRAKHGSVAELKGDWGREAKKAHLVVRIYGESRQHTLVIDLAASPVRFFD